MAIKKQQIVKEVVDLDLREESCNLEEEIRVRRMQLLSALKEISVLQQKSTATWLQLGDTNTSYYHNFNLLYNYRLSLPYFSIVSSLDSMSIPKTTRQATVDPG